MGSANATSVLCCHPSRNTYEADQNFQKIAFGEDADDGQSADRAVRQDVQRLDHLQDRLRLHLSPAKGERGVKTDAKAERNPTFSRS